MRHTFFLLVFLLVLSCKNSKSREAREPISKSETVESMKTVDSGLDVISTKDFTDFKILDSKNLTKAEIWETINPQMEGFTENDYNRLKPLILEKSITELQENKSAGKFSYEELVKFYLYRIRKFDRENKLSLNAVISINSKVIE